MTGNPNSGPSLVLGKQAAVLQDEESTRRVIFA
jgi:hypothetical protein